MVSPAKSSIPFFFLIFLILFSCDSDPEPRNVWVEKEKSPLEARYDMSGFEINGKAYLGLGLGESTFTDWWEYDPTSDSWSKKKDFPGKTVRWGICTSTDSKGYIGLGYATTYEDEVYENERSEDIWEYDPLDDAWIKIPQFPGGSLIDAAAVTLGSDLYIVGGYKVDQKEPFNNNEGCVYLEKEVWQYNSATKVWMQKTSVPTPMSGACYQARNMVSGISDGEHAFVSFELDRSIRDQLWRYDPVNDDWELEIETPGWPGVGRVSFTLHGLIYVPLDNNFWLVYNLNETDNRLPSVGHMSGGNMDLVLPLNGKAYVFYTDGSLWEFKP